MIERYEFRLFPKYGDLVQDLLAERRIATHGSVVLRGTVGDAVFQRLADLELQLRSAGLHGTFAGWSIRRSYTPEELQLGELFLLQLPITHLSAEEHGTKYIESDTCRQESFELDPVDSSGRNPRLVPRPVPCGLCSQQASSLRLPLGKLPRTRDLIRLFGGEVVLSERFSSLLMSDSYTGSDLGPILGKRTIQSPSRLLNIARGPRQLTVNSKPVEVSKECRFGADPFDRGATGSYQCSSGEIAGNMLLSALKVLKSSWDGSDFCRTRIYVGGRQGLFRPYQLLLVSRRLFHAMERASIKGFDYEVVELV